MLPFYYHHYNNNTNPKFAINLVFFFLLISLVRTTITLIPMSSNFMRPFLSYHVRSTLCNHHNDCSSTSVWKMGDYGGVHDSKSFYFVHPNFIQENMIMQI